MGDFAAWLEANGLVWELPCSVCGNRVALAIPAPKGKEVRVSCPFHHKEVANG
jgi:hypothetical protein